MIVSEVGVGNGVVSERVFEKGNSRVVEDVLDLVIKHFISSILHFVTHSHML